MSFYTTVEAVREALPLSAATSTADFADLITQISNGFDLELGFSFDGPHAARVLSGDGSSRLLLPRPGAAADFALTVVENGVTLDPALYELEPGLGRYLTRYAASGAESTWAYGTRNIVASYLPTRCPPILRYRCTVEVVRAFRAQQAGYARMIGTPGVSQAVYEAGFEDVTYTMLEGLRFTAGSGGPGWVTM